MNATIKNLIRIPLPKKVSRAMTLEKRAKNKHDRRTKRQEIRNILNRG